MRAVNRVGKGRASNRAEATPEVFTLDFAHFANGDGLTSDLVFVNVGTHPIRPALSFYDQEGQPMAAESVLDITGDLEVMEDGGLTVQTEMEPLGVLTISTHGRGALVSGSVRVAADEPIGGVLRFDNIPGVGVAGVGASPPVRDVLFPVRRQEAGINTGVAVHNLGEEAMEVTYELMQGGTVLDDVSIPLAANGQSSWFINEAFPVADTSDFVGLVRCAAPGEGMFTGVGRGAGCRQPHLHDLAGGAGGREDGSGIDAGGARLLVGGAWENKAMRRKRDDLIPITEVFSGLDGPVPPLRESSPQARHHFTRFDQVDQLVRASEADPDLGFMARLMALCSLPRTNPGDQLQYKRVNGPYTLYMTATGGNKLPFGNLPRLLLAWVCTEAVRTQSRELVLGRSLAEFMRTLGVLSSDSGGTTGVRTRLRNQMKRLFRCTVSLNYANERGDANVSSLIADRTEFLVERAQARRAGAVE